MTGRRWSSLIIFFLAFTVLMVGLHLSYLKLPIHWDELGQFVPAALDLYHYGNWIPHSTVPNIHPPGLMAILAAVWHVTGYSIRSARVTVLLIATVGVFFSFLLAIRLARGTSGAPAFAAVLFLIVSPLFFMQSMMVQLDMPVMTLTVMALWLFLEERYAWCAIVSTALVLVKETGVTTPLVFGMWLWLREGKRREAAYFIAPPLALGAWILALHHSTGYWLGSDQFAQENVARSMTLAHIAAAVLRNTWVLFGADGRWLGALALWIGWPLLRGLFRSPLGRSDWSVAVWVAGAQALIVTLFGGAMLERYLLPIFPVLFAAMAVAASAYPPAWRRASHTAMVGLLMLGWFWDAPYPTQFENSLAMPNFLSLQKEAGQYLEAFAPGRRIATTWPLADALLAPEFGYVEEPLKTVRLKNSDLASIADVNRTDYDLLVLYSKQIPAHPPAWPVLGSLWRRSFTQIEATDTQVQAALGMVPRMSWERRGQWITIYGPQ